MPDAGGHRLDRERRLAERLDLEADLREQSPTRATSSSCGGGRLERDREQHVLDRHAAVAGAACVAIAQARELDALVRRVLVDEHELAVALADEVRQIELAEVAQLREEAMRGDRSDPSATPRGARPRRLGDPVELGLPGRTAGGAGIGDGKARYRDGGVDPERDAGRGVPVFPARSRALHRCRRAASTRTDPYGPCGSAPAPAVSPAHLDPRPARPRSIAAARLLDPRGARLITQASRPVAGAARRSHGGSPAGRARRARRAGRARRRRGRRGRRGRRDRRDRRPRRARRRGGLDGGRAEPERHLARLHLRDVALGQLGRDLAVERQARRCDAGEHRAPAPPRRPRRASAPSCDARLHDVADRRGDRRGVGEPDLELLRVDVDVDRAGRHIDEHDAIG